MDRMDRVDISYTSILTHSVSLTVRQVPWKIASHLKNKMSVSFGFKNIFRISTFWGRWLRMTTSFSRWKKKIDQNMRLQKQEQTQIDQTKTRWLLLERNSLGGWWSSGWRAPAERWTTIRFKKNFFKKSIWNFLSGEWLPTQWTAALFRSSPNSSSRKSAGKTGH